MDDLKQIWKSAKGNAGRANVSAGTLISLAESKKKKALSAHYWNISILALLVIMLWTFFRVFFPFQETLSRTGVGLMIGGVMLRILIEIFSIAKSNKVRVSDATTQATEDTIAFYEFRKKIHGPVTLIIVLLYIIGFYFLSPEWSLYMPMGALIVMDAGFLVLMFVLAYFIRKGMMQELVDLQEVVGIKKQLS